MGGSEKAQEHGRGTPRKGIIIVAAKSWHLLRGEDVFFRNNAMHTMISSW